MQQRDNSELELPDYAIRNRKLWTRANKRYTAEHARESWEQDEIRWGTWDVPERELTRAADALARRLPRRRCPSFRNGWA